MNPNNIFVLILIIVLHDKINSSFLPYTINGKPCNSECVLWKNKYYYCYRHRHTKGMGWDYCSPMNGLDINGNECKENDKCDFWCNLKKGGKGKCSNGETNEKIKSISVDGYYCINDCSKYDNSYYSCDTLDGDFWNHKIKKSFCSLSPKVDYQEKDCKNECDYYGKDYSWCYLKKGGWGYCSKNRAKNDLGISSRGFFCKNECKRRNHDFFCTSNCGKFGNKSYSCEILSGGWDYCGAGDQIDYRGNECKENHKCDYYGEPYAWCYLKKGSWGYCTKSKSIEWNLDLKKDSLSNKTGKAFYKSILYNYPKSLTANQICSILPVTVPGQGKVFAKNCYIENNLVIGKVEIVFD